MRASTPGRAPTPSTAPPSRSPAYTPVGGFASGPLHLGWIQLQDRSVQRPIITPVLTGAGAFGVFYVGAHLVKLVPPLGQAVASVLQFADEGDERLVT